MLTLTTIALLLNLNTYTVFAEKEETVENIEHVESEEVEESDSENEDAEATSTEENEVEETNSSEKDHEVSSEEESVIEEGNEEEQTAKKKEQNASSMDVQNFSLTNEPILKNPTRHKRAIQLKKDLAKLGFLVPNTNFTRLYGSDTAKTVREFQSYYGLDSDGIVGPATYKKIDNILASPLQKGKRHKDTVQLKKNLAAIGYPVPGNGTTLYGPKTEGKVKEFQADHKLVVNGIADEVTLAKIQELSSDLKKGMRHKDVVQLKKDLAKLGFPVPGNGTTYFGPKTEDKVKDFQRYYGVKVTGIADQKTLDKLKEIVSTPLQYGKRHKDTVQLKKDLELLVLAVPGNGTTYYGTGTRKRVREFQQKHKLVVNGIADPVTLAKIKELVSVPMADGVYRQDVVQLKKDLAHLGFRVPGNGTPLFGSKTKQKVKEFQGYYFGLSVDGIAGPATLKKIEKIKSSPLQNRNRHKDTIQLKKDLAALGYPVPGNGTSLFGKDTEKTVKKFQADHNLVVNGIADEVTLDKIAKELKSTDSNKRYTSTNYNVTLNQALNIQMNQLQQTDKYRNDPAYVSASHVKIDRVEITGSSVNLRRTPNFNHSPVAGVKRGTRATFIEEVKGANHDGSNVWYKIKYNKQDVYVHSSLANLIGKASSNVNVRAGQGTSHHVYGTISKDSTVTILKYGKNWHEISYNAWRNPTRSDVEHYLNPKNNDEFQHLVLSSRAGATVSELNKVLSQYAKGSILEGKGKAFLDGATKHNVNEVYLVSHAFLETGRGGSDLAKGVEVGKNKSGKLVLVTNSNRKNLTNIKTTYNMFGIGAVDSAPLRGGAIRAYEEGWFTPEAAIRGGAKFVGERYIHNKYKQNTLYKMRWNPASPGYPQYATDIAWAIKQVNYYIKDIYAGLNNPVIHIDIPSYK